MLKHVYNKIKVHCDTKIVIVPGNVTHFLKILHEGYISGNISHLPVQCNKALLVSIEVLYHQYLLYTTIDFEMFWFQFYTLVCAMQFFI